MAKPKLILIDGSSYIFRAYYAIQKLSNSKGFPTNAIYGFVNMLLKTLEVEKPKKLAICFDTAKPSFRKSLYEDYKANREAAPDDLVLQFPYIFKAVEAFGVYQIQKENYEADDLIATLARSAEKEGYSVDIITGDKDLMQLVGPHIQLYDSMRDVHYDEAAVFEKFQVKPTQIVDYLALMGDSSDNIPGVTGIGKKTAAELLTQFGSLKEIYQNLDKIKQAKRREILESEKENAFLSQKLVRLDEKVPHPFKWEDFDYAGPQAEKLEPLFMELEFHTLLKRLGITAAKPTASQGEYETILKEEDLKRWAKAMQSSKLLCLDTETTSLNIHDAELVGLSFSIEDNKACYIPIGHVRSEAPGLVDEQLSWESVCKILKPLLQDPNIPKLGQNLKYDQQILRRCGIELKGTQADTLIASYLVNPDQKHDLDTLALRHLGHKNISYEEVTGTGKAQVLFSEVPIEKAAQYSAEDADVTFRVHQKLLPELKGLQLLDLYQEVEVPLVEVLSDMEFRGICVNAELLKKISAELEVKLQEIEEKIHTLCGEKLNIHSPKQLSRVLFEKLKLPTVKKTKTGYSTDEYVLEQLSKEHEVAKWIVKFREYSKLKSTYADGLLAEIHPKTQHIHTRFNQTVTATGRLSSSGPNLQNIPVGKEYSIREVFIPRVGWELLSADYSQVELRLLAHMSKDKALVKVFEEDGDVHELTAQLVFGKKKISPEERRTAKTINFGVVYGQTPFGLSKQLGISPTEAKKFIDEYFERYPGVKSYMNKTIELARKQGQVSTLLGRRRFLPEIGAQNRMRREMAERTAINTPLQGTAADLIKVAMVSIHKRLCKEGHEARMILQVHDELVLEVPPQEKKGVAELVKEEMETALPLQVPLRVEMGWGANWQDCK